MPGRSTTVSRWLEDPIQGAFSDPLNRGEHIGRELTVGFRIGPLVKIRANNLAPRVIIGGRAGVIKALAVHVTEAEATLCGLASPASYRFSNPVFGQHGVRPCVAHVEGNSVLVGLRSRELPPNWSQTRYFWTARRTVYS